MVKASQPALAAVPRELEDVGRTLGLTPMAVFFRITLPNAWPGVAAGCVLAFARALGEFGATLMLAGMIPGRTNTMALEIYAAWEMGDTERAGHYVLLLTIFSALVVLVAARFTPREEAR
jgi:molybdate transport system permease protein